MQLQWYPNETSTDNTSRNHNSSRKRMEIIEEKKGRRKKRNEAVKIKTTAHRSH